MTRPHSSVSSSAYAPPGFRQYVHGFDSSPASGVSSPQQIASSGATEGDGDADGDADGEALELIDAEGETLGLADGLTDPT